MKRIFLAVVIVCTYLNGFSQKIVQWKITDIENLIENSDSILVINFWATFCAPCIAEIPDLIKYSKKYKKDRVKLYLVSVDFPENYPSKVQKFVAKKRYDATMAWLNETNADFFCPKISGAWSGAIPATLIVNKKTGYRKFYEEKLSAQAIEKAIQKAIP